MQQVLDRLVTVSQRIDMSAARWHWSLLLTFESQNVRVSTKTKCVDYNWCMTPEALVQFDLFWDFVRRAEDEIRLNFNQGYRPDMIHDPWDDEFAAAYDAIRPHLVPQEERRMFLVPTGIPSRKPFTAASGHEALMFFLNPPRALFGSAESLDSLEYTQIMTRAMNELRVLQPDQLNDQNAVRSGVANQQSDPRNELSETQQDILDAVDSVPRQGKEIAARTDYTYDSVRKHLPGLIKLGLIKKHVNSGYYRD